MLAGSLLSSRYFNKRSVTRPAWALRIGKVSARNPTFS